MIPDESSICRFRHLLEEHGLSQQILAVVNTHLDSHGLVFKAGTIVDATLLAAPVSRNNTWHFEAKGHIGVQAQGQPIIHSTEFTTAKVDARGVATRRRTGIVRRQRVFQASR